MIFMQRDFSISQQGQVTTLAHAGWCFQFFLGGVIPTHHHDDDDDDDDDISVPLFFFEIDTTSQPFTILYVQTDAYPYSKYI